MNDIITVGGVVATRPHHIVTDEGLSVTSFRLISSTTGYDVDAGAWHRSPPNWFTVTAYRSLASNIAGCVSLGDPLLVSGRLSVNEWSAREPDESGVTAEIEADAVGHDLAWGTALFVRTVDGAGAGAGAGAAGADGDGDGDGDGYGGADGDAGADGGAGDGANGDAGAGANAAVAPGGEAAAIPERDDTSTTDDVSSAAAA